MKQNAVILALFVGAAVAQTRQDKDVKGPIFKADKDVDQCEVSGDDTVKGAVEAKKVSSDKVEKLKGELAKAVELVAEERAKRDEAVKAVVAKDEAFKAALADADKAENDAMKLYKAANDAQKLYDDAKALSDASKIVTDAMKDKWDKLKLDKEASEKAVSDAVAHKSQETDTELAKRDLYGGVIAKDNADGGGDCTKGACKVTDDAKTAYETAQASLKTPKADYDAKVIQVTDSKVIYDAAKAASDAGATVKSDQDAVVGADNTAGMKKAFKTADDALSDYGSSGDLKTKQTAFKDAGDAMGAAWKAVLVDEAASTYTGAATRDCTEQATTANWEKVDDTTRNETECKAECQKKLYFDFTTTKDIKDDSAYCYGFEIDSADKCRLYKKIIPTTAADNTTASGKGCWQRSASTKAKAAYVDDDKDGALATAVTAYTSTITATWDGKIDDQEVARRNLDLETKIQTYIDDEYLGKADTGLDKITEAKKKIYDDFVGEQTSLKTAADNLGMDDSKALSAHSNKTMAQLKTAYDDAVKDQAAAKLVWDAAKTELTRMVATDAINAAWKQAATTAFNDVDALYTGDGKQAKVYEGLDKDTTDKKKTWDDEQKKYTDFIALADYTDEAAKAKVTEGTSDIVAQKDVVDARGLAAAANSKVKDAIKAEKEKRDELTQEMITCAGLEVKVQEALEVCESKQYVNFRKTFQDATNTRGENLKTIKTLMDKREKDGLAKKPGSGKAGARCERPRSNGDARGRKDCEAELCCGAATKLIGQTEVTIETCQKLDATKYSYQPPRAAMGLAMPAVESWDFVCIAGAKRVLAAAAAAAAAGLMMQ